METAEIQPSLQSPLFYRLVEDGDGRCDLIWASPVTSIFSTLCAETLFPLPPPPPHISLSKTLEGLLMRLVIFVTLFFS